MRKKKRTKKIKKKEKKEIEKKTIIKKVEQMKIEKIKHLLKILKPEKIKRATISTQKIPTTLKIWKKKQIFKINLKKY